MTEDRAGAAVARLHTLAIRLLRAVRVVDAASGMSAARLSVLSVLVYGGARTIGELAAAEQVSAPTMTRLLQGLERDGHVQRGGVAGDRRAVRVRATARARRALEAARARRHEALRERLAALSPAEWRRVEAALAVLEPHLVT